MAGVTHTQVGIVGAGPAGLLLSHLLALRGISSVVVENRSREYCEARQRAGLLEAGTVELLRSVGLGRRLDAEGMEHGGIYLQFAGERHHLDFRSLTGGRWVTIYAQTEIVKDLIATRLAAGATVEFSCSQVSVTGVPAGGASGGSAGSASGASAGPPSDDKPVLSYVSASGEHRQVVCDVIAGCDGFHGICRPLIPELSVFERSYPYAWLGILAEVPPSTDELIYARHEEGFALHTMRTPQISRLYLQVPVDTDINDWPSQRIWAALARRLALPGWSLKEGPILEKSITPMRSFVAGPMRHGRLFLAGDAAHIVPPTGAKGLNLALGDVVVLANALDELFNRGSWRLADEYSDTCLARVWRATHFSWWMTSMLHVAPDQDPFESELQLAQLRYVVDSRAAATTLAENYSGYQPVTFG